MRKVAWSKWAALLTSGAFLLQTTSCVQAATVIGGLASAVTAGGVIYLITRVLE